MTDDYAASGDAASLVATHLRGGQARHHISVAEHLARILMTPAEHFGHTTEELLDLSRTRHHGGEPIVTPETLLAAHTSANGNAVRVIVGAGGPVKPDKSNLKQLILGGNCRTNNGGTWLNILQGGDTNANIGYENHSGAVAYTSTTVTPTASPSWTTNQWAGHEVYALTTIGATPTLVKGHIISNTATALTIDQWYAIASTSGAAGATPAANASFAIGQAQAPGYWIVLSSDTATEDIGNTAFTGEFTDGFATTGRWKGQYTQTTAPTGTGTTNSNAIYKLDAGVLTANATKTTAKLFLTHFQNGGTPDFAKKLATQADTISGDTLDPSWSITCS